jgi:FlaG/FlaF family flagellin (archaellin)
VALVVFDEEQGTRKSHGVSPVIATIILSAAVITIGAAVWNYSQGASTVIANNYVNDTLDLLNEVTERFTVEHVSNNSDGTFLYVWVYNYGDVDVVVDVYANATHYNSTHDWYNYTCESNLNNLVVSKGLVKIEISYESAHLWVGDSVAIKVHSWRQNNAYHKYYVS